MEIPILLVVWYFFSQSQTGLSVSSFLSVSGIMVGFCDALFQPRRYLSAKVKVAGKTMPVYTMLTSMVFYTVNGYLIGHYFGQLKDYPIGGYTIHVFSSGWPAVARIFVFIRIYFDKSS